MSNNAIAISALTPEALNAAGVPLEDALWLHCSSRAKMSFVQALGTERGDRILHLVRAHRSKAK